MKRSGFKRQSGFSSIGPKQAADRLAQKERNLTALMRTVGRSAVMGGTTAGPIPKPTEHRNQRLLDLARNQFCLFMVPGVCNHRIDTTVACHSNLAEHGKAGARKADDHWTVWGCCACHAWLDQGKADYETKASVFKAAHHRQVQMWKFMLRDSTENGFNKAAIRWALARIDQDMKEKTCSSS